MIDLKGLDGTFRTNIYSNIIYDLLNVLLVFLNFSSLFLQNCCDKENPAHLTNNALKISKCNSKFFYFFVSLTFSSPGIFDQPYPGRDE